MESMKKSHKSDPAAKKESKKRRHQVLVACNRCRRLRTRCDTARPSCGLCRRTNNTCVYDTDDPAESRSQAVRRKFDDLHALQQDARNSLDWLRSQGSSTVASCIQRLQRAEDPLLELCTVVAEERTKHLSLEITEQQVLIASSPLVKNTLTAELVVRYPASYPWIFGEDAAPAPTRQSPIRQSSPHDPSIYALREDVSKAALRPQETPRDPRLQDLDISFWTTVPISNELAANIIHLYMRVEQPVYGFFDPDLFLSDLLAHRTQYCSALLVNSVLFWASCTFGPIYPEVHELAGAFLTMAQRLLEGEHSVNSPMNVASLMILGIGAICFGKDVVAKEYAVAGVRMAEDVGLIGEHRKGIKDFNHVARDTLSLLSYVAWGAFNFTAVYLLHFHDAHGGTYTKRPPLLPRPGSEAFFQQTQRRDERTSRPSSYCGASFQYFCEFWCIAHEIGSVLYSAPGPLHQHVPLAFAESKFLRLLEWARSLPAEARRSDGMAHNVAEMHICYHATIMDLFRPFLAKGQVLSTFAASPRRPEGIFALSLGHLRALSRYYHIHFGGLPEAHTISWVHGPLYVAPAILHYERREGWQADFFSYIEACSDLLKSHQVMEGFLRALLGMAVFAEMLSVAQATEYLDNLKAARDEGYHGGVTETGFVIDQDLAVESRDAGVGDALVQRFDEMLFLEDPMGFR